MLNVDAVGTNQKLEDVYYVSLFPFQKRIRALEYGCTELLKSGVPKCTDLRKQS